MPFLPYLSFINTLLLVFALHTLIKLSLLRSLITLLLLDESE